MNKRGFTLLELLVVVLIIGILAAIALPQYKKAVYKSRFAALKNLTKSIANAEEIYNLSNGTYTDILDNLDIDFPSPDSIDDSHDTYKDYVYEWGMCRLVGSGSSQFTKCRNNSISMDYQIYFTRSPNQPGIIKCVLLNDNINSLQSQICKQETKKDTYSSSGTGWLAYTY